MKRASHNIGSTTRVCSQGDDDDEMGRAKAGKDEAEDLKAEDEGRPPLHCKGNTLKVKMVDVSSLVIVSGI